MLSLTRCPQPSVVMLARARWLRSTRWHRMQASQLGFAPSCARMPGMAFAHPGLHQCSSRCFLGGPTNEQLLPRGRRRQLEQSLQTTWWYGAAGMTIFALVFACVPLYKIYCQATGQGQASSVGHKEYSPPPSKDSVDAKRLVTVDFAATVHTSLPWQFVPQQRRVVVGLGETALAFYRAKNTSDRPIIGVSVYHMIPAEAGLYFNKIQCFCFDEQLINPGEEVDLPIFFFIDPMMGRDNRFDHVDHITFTRSSRRACPPVRSRMCWKPRRPSPCPHRSLPECSRESTGGRGSVEKEAASRSPAWRMILAAYWQLDVL
eukprot:s481_g27.t3